MKKKSLILVVGAIALAATVAACGHYRYHGDYCAEHAGWMVERMSRKLDLTEEQKAKLDVVKTRIVAARDAAAEQRESDAKAIAALLSQPTFDRARAIALTQSHTRTIETRAPEVIAAFADFYDGLKPEQQQKLREQVESRMNNHNWW